MAKVKDLIIKYLDEARMMQLATCSLLTEREKSSELVRASGSAAPTSDEKNQGSPKSLFFGAEYRRLVSSLQPWCCTVYFAVDNLHNLYWISKPDRRHSQEIAQNPNVAGAIALPHTPGDKVRGIQFEGTASELTEQQEIMEHIIAYEERYQRPGLGAEIVSGANPHRLYQIKPALFVLFDELNFPDNPRQEWRPGELATE